MKRFILPLLLLSALAGRYTAAYPQGKLPGRLSGASVRAPHTRIADGTKDGQDFVTHIESYPQLKSHVEKLLPAGMNLKAAAMGFRNQGQFIAALHVSKNLNIPFDQLKAKVTGDHPESLGKAIQELRADLSEKDAKAEADKAEKQAKEAENSKLSPLV